MYKFNPGRLFPVANLSSKLNRIAIKSVFLYFEHLEHTTGYLPAKVK